ncbi:TetM/TetW/TetO/TetS family tetracycline resistance ribosomal protection protein [Bizionia gelidisalsuginis]|uniref:Tetracycline resistance protein TetQ n=2 Tax=Bizionia TaxID=283785 RepID=A0A8H2QLN6_9FLAO|nr:MULTISPECIES: TetM/TetW/TetO/TetS family tetracycline resistance ribosomal protection protein [Bizionia]TYB74493.1 TetM/TetW/TetO/TetS family tetracycline resistance ribosomal protection protein [Bizionia saleffrena]TYC16288.1 TetM/TetW/TetO/TetS family tetracycline resistance ribosomal protection protein [Bizionia gelidisalsuginis]
MLDKTVLTIGILAHVDAGKTSITECLLHHSGTTKSLGSVDKGSAITDGLTMEKSRGISIKASSVNFSWEDSLVQLVDTPGHIDFSAEVDRSLSILDGVILVVSAKEGVQAHTLNLWESLIERKLPVIIFFNKIDRAGVDVEHVFLDFQKDLGAKLFALNYPDVSNIDNPKLLSFTNCSNHTDSKILEKSLENLAECDETFLAQYLEGETSDLGQVLKKGKQNIKTGGLYGALFGSAKLGLGIEELLNSILTFIPQPKSDYSTAAAKVFKVTFHEKKGKLAYLKVYGGTLKSKDVIRSQRLDKGIKINQIFKTILGDLVQCSELHHGEIGVVTTSDSILSGDILGSENLNDHYSKISKAVLGVQVIAKDVKKYQKLGEALEILNIEDPILDFKWFKEEKEFHLKILGPIQTEVLKENLIQRWAIEAEFQKPKVIYKETPSKSAEGYVRYWMPKPCWAIMTFLIEPAPLGSGISFTSNVRTSDISNKYINEVKRAIPWSLRQGILGYEVTDLSITLIAGTEHTVHSNPGDFLLATPMGVLKALENAGTDLLEPMYAFEIKASQDLLGPISSDLNQMNAQIDAPVFDNDFFILRGRVSVAAAMSYSIKFNATTSGKGRLKLVLDGYKKTSITEDKIRSYKGVSPLDESQWILHMRGAFKADDRKSK